MYAEAFPVESGARIEAKVARQGWAESRSVHAAAEGAWRISRNTVPAPHGWVDRGGFDAPQERRVGVRKFASLPHAFSQEWVSKVKYRSRQVHPIRQGDWLARSGPCTP